MTATAARTTVAWHHSSESSNSGMASIAAQVSSGSFLGVCCGKLGHACVSGCVTPYFPSVSPACPATVVFWRETASTLAEDPSAPREGCTSDLVLST
jgi:hypothetical protein